MMRRRQEQATSLLVIVLWMLLSNAIGSAADAAGGSSSSSSSSMSLSSSSSSSSARTTTTAIGAKRAKVVVVGSGRMGRIRIQLIHANPKLQLVGIVDSDLSAAQALAQTYHVPAFQSLEEVKKTRMTTMTTTTQKKKKKKKSREENAIDDDDDDDDDDTSIKGLICCSPTTTHRLIVEQAIRHHPTISHIFLEKPVEESAPKIEALFDLASKHNVELCCGFQRRFDPSYQAALEQLPNIIVDAENDDEVLVYANIFFGDHPVPPMEFLLQGGGDIFMDLSAHDVDYVLQALNNNNSNQRQKRKQQSVISVFATGTSSTTALQRAGVHDNATLLLTCSGGTVVTIFLSRSATYGYDQRAEFFGRGGRIQVGNIHETSTVVSTNQGICHSKYQHSFPQRFHQAFGNEMDAFADILLGKEEEEEDDDDDDGRRKKWPVTKDDCIRVQQVADAAQESARTGQVVTLRPYITGTATN